MLREVDEHVQRRVHNLVAEVSARFLWALDQQRFVQMLNQSGQLTGFIGFDAVRSICRPSSWIGRPKPNLSRTFGLQ